MALLTGISISQRLAFHSLKESLETHAVQHSLLLAQWTHYGFQCDITRIIPIVYIYKEEQQQQQFFYSFTARHRKSFYNNRNEIKKGKKKSNKNCLNINNNFGIIQKRHLFARLTLLFHMPFDVKKHFYYFLWWFRLNDKNKRKATFCHWRIQFHKEKYCAMKLINFMDFFVNIFFWKITHNFSFTDWTPIS